MIGATVQISYLLYRFFSYELLTTCHVGDPESTLLPDIAICFPILDAINYTALFLNYPSILGELGYRPGTRVTYELIHSIRAKVSDNYLLFFFQERLKIDQLWKQIVNSSMIYRKAFVHKATDDDIIRLPCSSNDFFMEKEYCYSFTCSSAYNSSEPIVTEKVDLYKKLTTQEVFTLEVPQSFFRTIDFYWVSLIPRGELPRGNKIKWESQEAYDIARKHTFFFYYIEIRRLGPPYPTNCANYSDRGYLSRVDMEDKCEINLSLQKIGSPLPTSIVDKPLDAPFGSYILEKNIQNETYLDSISKIAEACLQIASQPDCYEINYFPLSRTPLPIQGNYTEITVEQVSDPIYTISIEPKMTLLDLIISIGSVLGTWLGFSIVDSIPQVASFIGVKFFNLPLRKDDQYRDNSSSKLSVPSAYLVRPKSHSKKKDIQKRAPPFYTYYDDKNEWPLFYNVRARPWWPR